MKIICIDDNVAGYCDMLTLGKNYKVSRKGWYDNRNKIHLITDDGDKAELFKERFEPDLKEKRRKKLEKLNSL